MFTKAATAFRVVAVAEALSWAALLVGMFFKYVVGAGEGGVPVVGMIHGVIFIAYLVTTFAVFRVLKWGPKTLLLALFASIPPLLTWAFEVWALRNGKFDGPEVQANAGMGLATQPAA